MHWGGHRAMQIHMAKIFTNSHGTVAKAGQIQKCTRHRGKGRGNSYGTAAKARNSAAPGRK
eukprot:9462504-Prorocentrum_lima.AAC.1